MRITLFQIFPYRFDFIVIHGCLRNKYRIAHRRQGLCRRYVRYNEYIFRAGISCNTGNFRMTGFAAYYQLILLRKRCRDPVKFFYKRTGGIAAYSGTLASWLPLT